MRDEQRSRGHLYAHRNWAWPTNGDRAKGARCSSHVWRKRELCDAYWLSDHTLVYGAGNYRFSDFVKIGLPMNIVVG